MINRYLQWTPNGQCSLLGCIWGPLKLRAEKLWRGLDHLDVIEALVALQHLRRCALHVEVAQAVPARPECGISQVISDQHSRWQVLVEVP